MKSLLKFTLLSALIISGKLAKQSSSVATAQSVETKSEFDPSVVMVNQILDSESAKPAAQNQPQQPRRMLLSEVF